MFVVAELDFSVVFIIILTPYIPKTTDFVFH